MANIGFAGLGLMGSRMAENFLKKGHSLTVWNRTAAACELLRARGAKVAETPTELATGAEVVFTCLADPEAVSQVFLGEAGLLKGAKAGMRFVDTSTISPGLARELAQACRERGAEYLECPVTGSKQGAQDGTLLLMTGGRRGIHDELEPLLSVIGKRAIYMGETGTAATMKLIGNTLISFMLEGLAEAFTLGKRGGLKPEQIIEVVQGSGFASPYWAFKGGAMARRDFTTHFTIDLLHKDQRLALAEAGTHHVPMPGLAAIHQVCSCARAQGVGGEDIAAVIKAVETMAGEPARPSGG
jgi:3-hydroxyisobutyrate dehydrogenase-like beta-hydroxyacid dehydrogenase